MRSPPWRLDRRCLGANRYFRRLRAGAVAGHAVADLDPESLAPLLANLDALSSRSSTGRTTLAACTRS